MALTSRAGSPDLEIVESSTRGHVVRFISEFADTVRPLMPLIISNHITVAVNAGGLDPFGLIELIEGHNTRVKVAAV